jgi:hypothetical protein
MMVRRDDRMRMKREQGRHAVQDAMLKDDMYG